MGGVEFSSNQRLSQVLPALLQNEIEEDELGILKCEQHNGAKFVLNSIQILKFQNKSSTHHRNKQVKLEGNCEVSLDTQVNWAGLAVRRGKKSPCQETGLGNRGHLKVLNHTKLVLNEHE